MSTDPRFYAWLLRDEAAKEQRVGDSYADTAPDVAEAHRTLAKAMRAGAEALAPLVAEVASVGGAVTTIDYTTHPAHTNTMCPAGHGPMTYDIGTGYLHCHCGAKATTHGNIIVDPDPVETKRP